ncbi:hypothetical protein JQN72_13055 [Phycicoccus sp. CSK15P-2]|uniref:hypothetical protein n=1 Tax=Phycicoccus sp. CSK15P-2 TaxID=2807627 RepID=UPI0019516616|nr:hypothetical protein [Phycicoccus sp. CSK15P-2]MBM6405170.1 hypothetical protein [Phycicoccus sp. CSK15P-2]
MSFDDLPESWSDLPLDDPRLAADVVDLLVGHADRLDGCLCLLLLDDGLRLLQPVLVSEGGQERDPRAAAPGIGAVLDDVAAAGGALVFARGRDGSVLLTDTDRVWHEVVLAESRRSGAPLVGAYLATPAAVRSFPAPLGEAAAAS